MSYRELPGSASRLQAGFFAPPRREGQDERSSLSCPYGYAVSGAAQYANTRLHGTLLGGLLYPLLHLGARLLSLGVDWVDSYTLL